MNQRLISRKLGWLFSIFSIFLLVEIFSLHAFSAPGDLRWQVSLGTNISGAPTLAKNGDVLIGLSSGKVLAITPEGSNRWTFVADQGVMGVPAVAEDGTIYFGAGRLFALNADGTKRWDFALDAFSNSGWNICAEAPSIGPDGVVYVMKPYAPDGERRFYAVNPDGTRRWKLEGQWIGRAAIGFKGEVYASSQYADFARINPDGVVRWSLCLGNTIHSSAAVAPNGTLLVPVSGGSINDGAVRALTPEGVTLWRFDGGGMALGSPIVGSDGVTYYGFGNGRLVAIGPEGRLQWEYNMPGTNTYNMITSSPALVNDGTVYFSGDSYFHALDSQGRLLWRIQPGSNILTAPLVAPDGTIYVGDNGGNLFAIEGNGNGLAAGAWPMSRRNERHTASIASIPVLPNSPSGLTVSMGTFSDKVQISWNSVDTATHYAVLRGESTNLTDAQVLTNAFTGGTVWDDRTAQHGVTNYYFVRAINQSGSSAAAGPIEGLRKLAEVGEPVWIFPTDGILDSCAIRSDGSLVFGSSDGNLYAVDPDGQLMWHYTFGGYTYSTPSVGADDTVYFSAAISRYPAPITNALIAVDADGHLRWQILAGAELVNGFAVGVDGTVYTSTGDYSTGDYFNPSTAFLWAISPDGNVLWKFSNGCLFNVTPTLGADGTIYAGSVEGWMHALRPDGTLLWQCNTGDSCLQSAAINAQGVLYTSGANFLAINSDGQLLWSYPRYWGGHLSCIDSQGYLYSDADHGYWCLDPDFAAIQKFELPSSIDDMINPVTRDANGIIYLTTYSGYTSVGRVYAITNGVTLWGYDLDQGTFGTATMGNGHMLYVPSSNGRLYALRTSAGLSDSAWPHWLHDPQHTVRSTQIPPAPASPDSVNATFRTRITDVRVSWLTSLGATFYDVFRGTTTNASDAELIGSVTGQLFFDDKTADNEKPYTYFVRARNMAGASEFGGAPVGVRRQAVPGEMLYEWSVNTYPVSEPALGNDGTIYVTSYDVMASLGKDGTTHWTLTNAAGQFTAPTIGNDGTIYVGAGSSGLLALSPDGGQKWQFNILETISSCPSLGADGTIYFAAGHHSPTSTGSLYALNPDGQLRWSTSLGCTVLGATAVGRDGTIYALDYNGPLFAVTSTGTLLWKVETAGYQSQNSLAILEDGTICVAARDDGVKLYNPDGTLRRQLSSLTLSVTPVIGTNGWVIMGGNDGRMNFMNPAGTNVLSTNTGGYWSSSPAVSQGGMVYAGNDGGKLMALSHTAAIVWECNVGASLPYSPCIAPDGSIYIGTSEGKLVSVYGTEPLASTSWPMYQHDAQHTGRDTAPATVPTAATFVTASDGQYNDRIRVSWSNSPAAGYYEIWRHTTNDSSSAIVICSCVGGQNWYEDTAVLPGTNYFYWVRSVNGLSGGPLSTSDIGYRRVAIYGEYLGQFSEAGTTTGTPAVSQDGTVYIGIESGKLYALTPDLKKRWEFVVQGVVYSPVVDASGVVYFWCSDDKFYAVNPNGSRRWTFADVSSQNLSAAIGSDGVIVVPNGNRILYGLNPDGTLRWEYRVSSNIVSSPSLAADGSIYFGSDDSQLYALNPNGTLRWRFRVNGPVRSSPAIGSDGTIYFGADDGGCYAVTPDGQRRWAGQANDVVRSGPVIGQDVDANGSVPYTETSLPSLVPM